MSLQRFTQMEEEVMAKCDELAAREGPSSKVFLEFVSSMQKYLRASAEKDEELLNEYAQLFWAEEEENVGFVYDETFCEKCNKDCVYELSCNDYICDSCGICKEAHISESYSRHEWVNEKVHSGVKKRTEYKRLNYFKTLLMNLQGHLDLKLPRSLDSFIRQYRGCKMSRKTLVVLLKKRGFHLQVPRANELLKLIDPSYKVPMLTRREMHVLETDFMRVNDAFRYIDRNGAKSLGGYQFILSKLLSRNGFHELSKFTNLSVSRSSIKRQQLIWERVCEYNNWSV